MAQTIFALSSGSGPAGVAVFRLSGPQTRKALVQLCGGPLPAPRQASLRVLHDPAGGGLIDQALVLFFPAPASFTGEDVAELHVHGSLAIIRQLAEVLGAMTDLRAAQAGEFTQRALANGKMDLLAVEALSDLLAAETHEQAQLARKAQQGLRRQAGLWREALLEALALTEAGIDFSDEDDVGEEVDSLTEQTLSRLEAGLAAAIQSYAHGERIRRGFRVALCGPPNAGKSSLLNALARREVAIVSPIAGTTRDVLEVHLDLGGYAVIIADTAGLRDSDDVIEREGISRAIAAAADSDLVLWLSPADSPAPSGVENAVEVTTKSDLAVGTEGSDLTRFVSVMTGQGLDRLILWLEAQARATSGQAEGLVLANARQRAELVEARKAIAQARERRAAVAELRAEDLREALRHLDRLTGRIDSEEVLGAIFSRFCIGK